MNFIEHELEYNLIFFSFYNFTHKFDNIKQKQKLLQKQRLRTPR